MQTISSISFIIVGDLPKCKTNALVAANTESLRCWKLKLKCIKLVANLCILASVFVLAATLTLALHLGKSPIVYLF